MKVSELFFSIQGESFFAGMPCVFIRLSGCNLRCSWCDTAYAFDNGTEMTMEAILEQVEQYGCRLIEITGGEPLIQDEVYPLIDRLVDKEYTVLVETGGSIHLGKLNPKAVKIMDIKCPGSTMQGKMDFSNIELLSKRDEIKFVIVDETDYDYAKSIISKYGLLQRTNVIFSPVHEALSSRTLAKWILKDRLPVRLQIQLHKYIWGKDIRGV